MEYVTIGLCVKNSEKTIKRALASIVNQKYPKELIQLSVVDGCSEDQTIPLLNSIIPTTGLHVDVYSDDGRGLGAARQIVINNAKGEYVVFLGGDAELHHDYIRKQVEFMNRNPEVGIVAGKSMLVRGNLLSTVWSLRNFVVEFGFDAITFRLDAVREVGGFDIKIKGASEDKDLMLRIEARGWKILVNREAKFFHYGRMNLRTFWNEQSWYGYGNHYLYNKHKSVSPLWRNFPIGSFRHGLKLALKAYSLTNQKASFCLPLQMVFANVAWWFGFFHGHLDGYGHLIN